MIAIIRIKGQVGVNKDVKNTLERLKLKKKYTCVVLKNPGEIEKGMLKKVRNFVAFGEISEETYKKLKDKRETKIEDFFRLHPPRGGIDSKKHFGVDKGVLGDNKKEINKLIERML
jgi:large subunit ribosomal protein L30